MFGGEEREKEPLLPTLGDHPGRPAVGEKCDLGARCDGGFDIRGSTGESGKGARGKRAFDCLEEGCFAPPKNASRQPPPHASLARATTPPLLPPPHNQRIGLFTHSTRTPARRTAPPPPTHRPPLLTTTPLRFFLPLLRKKNRHAIARRCRRPRLCARARTAATFGQSHPRLPPRVSTAIQSPGARARGAIATSRSAFFLSPPPFSP